MLRFLILSGYFELMMYLQVSGKLDQYINVHYRYLAILSMILSALLALVQLYLWVKNGKAEEEARTIMIMTMGCRNLINVGSLMYC